MYFFGKPLSNGIKAITTAYWEHLGITAEKRGLIFTIGERKYFTKALTKLQEELIEKRDRVKYVSGIHEYEHAVELQTVFTTALEVIIHELSQVKDIRINTEQKFNDYYNNHFLVENKFILDDIETFAHDIDNLSAQLIDLNKLKGRITTYISRQRQIIPVNEGKRKKQITTGLFDRYKKYIIEIVIPQHEKIIGMIKTRHNGNFLGAALVEKFELAIKGYRTSIGGN